MPKKKRQQKVQGNFHELLKGTLSPVKFWMGKKLKPYFLDEVVSRTSCGEIGNRATGGFIAILSLFQIIKKWLYTEYSPN